MDDEFLSNLAVREPHDHWQDRDDCARLMERLSDRQRYVIEQRFWNGRTLREIGTVLGITRERARQIQNRALERMRVKVTQAMLAVR